MQLERPLIGAPMITLKLIATAQVRITNRLKLTRGGSFCAGKRGRGEDF